MQERVLEVVAWGRIRPTARERQGNEEIRKFLNFYKRKNSLCVILYLPAFFKRKSSYDDIAEFVYSVLSEGGTLPPNVIRAVSWTSSSIL